MFICVIRVIEAAAELGAMTALPDEAETIPWTRQRQKGHLQALQSTITPSGVWHHGPGRFRRLKRVSRNITRSRGICIIAWDGFPRLKRISRNITFEVGHYAPDWYRIGIIRGRRGDVYGGEGDGAAYRGAAHSRLTASARTALPLRRRGCRP